MVFPKIKEANVITDVVQNDLWFFKTLMTNLIIFKVDKFTINW